jgi:hypothetical protein
LTGIVLGMLLLVSGVLLTRAGPGQTRPATVVPALAPLADATSIPDQELPIRLGDADAEPDLRLHPNGAIEMIARSGTLYISPYLSFSSLAQDGLWAIAGNRDVSGVVLREVQRGRLVDGPALQVRWEGQSLRGWLRPGDLAGELRISRRRTVDGSVEFQVTTITRVARQLDAHQADYVDVSWSGLQPLSLALGPEPGYPLVPTESDYPFGRPLTFLSVLPEGVDLMRASSAEKGPFTRLAHWLRHDPVVRIHAAGQLVCTFVLEGFVAQASPELSPTAGWGMPVNSIVVEATAFRDQQPTGVWVGYTLADTGLGRGYHTVGTAPGTYVSTLRITLPAGSFGE